MDAQWVKAASWHILLSPTRMPGLYLTRCGRRVKGPVLDERAGDEKTCETCLRIVTPK